MFESIYEEIHDGRLRNVVGDGEGGDREAWQASGIPWWAPQGDQRVGAQNLPLADVFVVIVNGLRL